MKKIAAHAAQVLETFFLQLDFDVNRFLNTHRIDQEDRARLLSQILYGIYYSDHTIKALSEKKDVDNLLLILLAEVVSERKLRHVLAKLPLRQKISLACRCMLHQREGSWAILVFFESFDQQDKPWMQLIHGLRRRLYDPNLFITLPEEKRGSLQEVLMHFDRHANQEIMQIIALRPFLYDLVIKFPTLRFDQIEGVKQRVFKLIEQLEKVAQRPHVEQEVISRKEVEDLEAFLVEKLTPLIHEPLSFGQARQFFEFFGIRGYPVPIGPPLDSEVPLVQALKRIPGYLTEPKYYAGNTAKIFSDFVIGYFEKMHVFLHNPEKIASGLDRIVYTLATRGKELAKLAWLPSVISGLVALVDYLGSRGIERSLSSYPIVLFDQAGPKEFAENTIFIQELVNRYGATIWHLSSQKTLALAERLGVLAWIKTTPEGSFGFGGARNCLFLLAPLIQAAFKRRGLQDIDQLLALSEAELNALFASAVLGRDGQDVAVHLGEDDVGILPSHFFSEALWADNLAGQYYNCSAYCYGRGTYLLDPIMELKTVLHQSARIFTSTRWESVLSSGGMKGQLSKPRFCLPLPFGHEEANMLALRHEFDMFQQAVCHLGGSRYPQYLYPDSPSEGVLAYLRTYLPYSYEIHLLTNCFDTTNMLQRNALPWNDESAKRGFPHHSLYDVWQAIAKPEVQAEMRKRFWRNLSDLLESTHPHINLILAYAKLDPSSQGSLEMQQFYRKIQREALLFVSFGEKLLKYHLQDDPDYVEKARREAEDRLKMDIPTSLFARKLYLLVRGVLSFEELLNQTLARFNKS
jgi:hypothetical protein